MKPYCALETRSQAEREADHLKAINCFLANPPTETWKTHLEGQTELSSLDELAKLPVAYKSNLPEEQGANRPFGGWVPTPTGELRHLFLSPGPIADPEPHAKHFWSTERVLHHAGFTAGDRVQNCFAYHFTPAGFMFEQGLHNLGCAVIPAGPGQTELQARAIEMFGTNGYVGTPDYLKIIIEKCRELNIDFSGLTKACVTGGYLSPDLKDFYAEAGVRVLECYGTADIGLGAYQSAPNDPLWVNENMIIEVVRPGTGIPVAEGEIGEMLITRLDPTYPLLRFSTGDLTAMGPTATGERTCPSIVGWRGRADQAAKVKGQFVRPQQVQAVVSRHPEISKARLVVTQHDGRDQMTLKVVAEAQPTGFKDAIAATVQAVTMLKGEIELVDQLPNDGLVVEDCREL